MIQEKKQKVNAFQRQKILLASSFIVNSKFYDLISGLTNSYDLKKVPEILLPLIIKNVENKFPILLHSRGLLNV